jgi:hypothetical protein
MNEQKSNLYLLTGLVIGLVAGLVLSWWILPVQYVDIEPAALSGPYQDEYRRALALAYQSNGDLERARERLQLLHPSGETQALAAQAQRMLAENRPPQEARALAVLAADLARPASTQQSNTTPQTAAEAASAQPTSEATQPANLTATDPGTVLAIQTATPALPTRTPTATFTPLPTFTPRPTATPILILDAPFTLKSKQEICDGSVPPGLLQVYVYGADSKPLPGVRIQVTWEGGEDVFYTGLVPEVEPGYADFYMQSNLTFFLKVGATGTEVGNLRTTENCGWAVTFIQSN